MHFLNVLVPNLKNKKPVEALERRLLSVHGAQSLHHALKPRARKGRTQGTMGEEQMEVEETTLPEENQEVDASIQLCHKIFALSNPSQGTDVSALGDEVKQIVLDRGASRDAANPSRAMRRFHARHAPSDPARTRARPADP